MHKASDVFWSFLAGLALSALASNLFGCAQAPMVDGVLCDDAHPCAEAEVILPGVVEETGGSAGAAPVVVGEAGDSSVEETGGSSTGGNTATGSTTSETGGTDVASTGGSSSSTGGTVTTGGTTSTTGGTDTLTCDSTTARSCECDDGSTGIQWMRGDCTGLTSCVNCVLTGTGGMNGTGGNVGTGSVTTTTGGSSTGGTSATGSTTSTTGGTDVAGTGGSSSSTGGTVTTGGTAPVIGETVVLRFYALDGVTWTGFVLAVTGLMQSDYTCTGTATFQECVIPNLDMSAARRFYVRTGPEGVYEWIPRDNWETGSADSNHAAVYVYRSTPDLQQMDFRYVRNMQNTGYEFEIWPNGTRPGLSDDDQDGLASPNDCDDGNPSLETNCGIAGGGGPDLVGTGGTGGITGGGGGDLATGGTGGTSTSTVRTVQIDFLHRDPNTALYGDASRVEVSAPAYQNIACASQSVPDPAFGGQFIPGFRCTLQLDLSRETEMQGFVGGNLYLAAWYCGIDSYPCPVDRQILLNDFRAYAYYADGSSWVPLAALDQGNANWTREIVLRYPKLASGALNYNTVHAFIPAIAM